VTPVSRAALLVLLVAAAGRGVAGEDAPVRYRISYPGGARLRVRVELPPLAAGRRHLVVPRAVPMAYGDQPYDRFVSDVTARAPTAANGDGRLLPVAREDGPRWLLGEPGAVVATVEYTVDLERMEREVLDASLASRARPGFTRLLLHSVLAFVDGLEGRPAHLRVEAPPGWPVLLTLAPEGRAGAVEADAGDYGRLADAQVAMGPALVLRRAEVRAAGRAVDLHLALYSEAAAPVDADRLLALAGEALARVADYFGEAPFARYSVLVEYLAPLSPAHAYGMSLEHRESGTFDLAADDALVAATDAEAAARLRYNLAHHVAHAWIPVRCHGAGYEPFPWELPPIIDTIWVSEGFVQYAALVAVAAALPPAEREAWRARMVERRFRRALDEAPAFLRRMGLIDLSRVASTHYAADFRTGRLTFARGALLAEAIDRRVTRRTGGARSLREALRALWASCAGGRSFGVAELPGLFARATGVAVGDLFERWLAPLDPPPGPSPGATDRAEETD
jgi:predicted metalloprotease with PDZ domain